MDKQKCSVVVMVVVVIVVVVVACAYMVGMIVDKPASVDVVQETLNSIEDTMVYPQVWWSDRTLTIYFIEVSNQLRSCSPIERPILETRLTHYYNMMIERDMI